MTSEATLHTVIRTALAGPLQDGDPDRYRLTRTVTGSGWIVLLPDVVSARDVAAAVLAGADLHRTEVTVEPWETRIGDRRWTHRVLLLDRAYVSGREAEVRQVVPA